MILNHKHIHKSFKLNGEAYSYDALIKKAKKFTENGDEFEINIGNFLLDWLDDSNTIQVETSGSTSIPKSITIKKGAMINSALATKNFFKLNAGESMLHCLPTRYIAGKMMLVRALVVGMEIDCILPNSAPKINLNKSYDFCAMIPLQLQNSLIKCDKIQSIIVGGAPMSDVLKHSVQALKTNVFETYGMTETISHIAVKSINKSALTTTKSPYFNVLPDISISQDERNCLVINAHRIGTLPIITNDIVIIHSKSSFEWIGRFDAIINSGGLKISPELIERKLEPFISERFFIASEKDQILGDKLILILESDNNTFDSVIFECLEKHMRPKKSYIVSQFDETPSGKIHRLKTLKSLNI